MAHANRSRRQFLAGLAAAPVAGLAHARLPHAGGAGAMHGQSHLPSPPPSSVALANRHAGLPKGTSLRSPLTKFRPGRAVPTFAGFDRH